MKRRETNTPTGHAVIIPTPDRRPSIPANCHSRIKPERHRQLSQPHLRSPSCQLNRRIKSLQTRPCIILLFLLINILIHLMIQKSASSELLKPTSALLKRSETTSVLRFSILMMSASRSILWLSMLLNCRSQIRSEETHLLPPLLHRCRLIDDHRQNS